MSIHYGGRGPGHIARVQGGSAYDYYVDSVAGNDSNAGTEAAPFQTLAKVVTVAANNKRIALKKGSTWREAFDLHSYSGVTVAAYGSGAAPVITGFDVVTGWTDDTATVAGRWYKDVAHNSNGTNRQVVIDNGVLMRRVASAAAVNSAGKYYSADCSTGATIRVYINVSGNPNSDGHTYEVTTRNNCGYFGPSANISGIVFRGAVSNNGPLEAGLGSTVTQCLAAFGTKHNALVASGTVTDCVFFDADVASASEVSVIPFVSYAADLRGQNITLTRCMFWNQYITSVLVYSHTSTDPTNQIDAITVDQCIGYADPTLGGGGGVGGGADAVTVSNSCFNGAMNYIAAPTADAITVTRAIGEQRSDAQGAIGSTNTSATVTISQAAVSRNTVSGGSKGFIVPLTSQTIALSNCSYDTPDNFFGQALGYFSNTTFTTAHNRMLVEANNAISKHASSTMGASDNNVYVRPSGGGGIGPFATWEGTATNLSSAFATWRTNSGKDANSIALTSTPFTGTTSNGDFQVSSAAQIGGVYSGCTEHWNFNTRAVVSTPPTRWPVGPRTYAEALSYIAAPASWNFYP